MTRRGIIAGIAGLASLFGTKIALAKEKRGMNDDEFFEFMLNKFKERRYISILCSDINDCFAGFPLSPDSAYFADNGKTIPIADNKLIKLENGIKYIFYGTSPNAEIVEGEYVIDFEDIQGYVHFYDPDDLSYKGSYYRRINGNWRRVKERQDYYTTKIIGKCTYKPYPY